MAAYTTSLVPAPDTINRRDQITIQAVEDNTTVTLAGYGLWFGIWPYVFNRVTLDAGQTFYYSPRTYFYDTTTGPALTGTRVTADKPIAVSSGDSCASVEGTKEGSGHLAEQMPSVAALSTSYLVSPTPRSGDKGNVVYLLAAEDNTDVKINGLTVAHLRRNSSYQGRVAAGASIEVTLRCWWPSIC